jgi:hypothetical protein
LLAKRIANINQVRFRPFLLIPPAPFERRKLIANTVLLNAQVYTQRAAMRPLGICAFFPFISLPLLSSPSTYPFPFFQP